MAFSGKADQINWSASLNSENDFGLGCSIAPKPDNPRVNWVSLIIGNEVTAT